MTSPPHRRRLGLLLACLALGLSAAAAPAAQTIDLGKGWPVTVADLEAEVPLTGAHVTVPKPANPRVPDSHAAGRRGDDGALTLQFTNAWIAQLLWQGGPPLDLRPYLPRGTVEFDLNVIDLAHGGIRFSLSRYTTDDEIDRALEVLPPIITRLRSVLPVGAQ